MISEKMRMARVTTTPTTPTGLAPDDGGLGTDAGGAGVGEGVEGEDGGEWAVDIVLHDLEALAPRLPRSVMTAMWERDAEQRRLEEEQRKETPMAIAR